jgi:hypothetical protein
VRQLCGDPAPEQLDRWMLRQACREAAFRNAAPQVDALVQRDSQFATQRVAARPAG